MRTRFFFVKLHKLLIKQSISKIIRKKKEYETCCWHRQNNTSKIRDQAQLEVTHSVCWFLFLVCYSEIKSMAMGISRAKMGVTGNFELHIFIWPAKYSLAIVENNESTSEKEKDPERVHNILQIWKSWPFMC